LKSSLNLLHSLAWPIALGLATWILAKLPLASLPQAIAGLQVWQWLAWMSINLAVIILLAWRWLVLARAIGLAPGFLQILRVRQAGQVISFVTPGPQFGGEPLQVFWLWKRYCVPGPDAFLAVGLDRFYELWINFGILLVAVLGLLAFASMNVIDWHYLALVLLILVLAMAVSGWLLLRQPAPVRAWVRRLTKPWRHHVRLRQLETHWWQLNESLQRVFSRHRSALGVALGLSLLAWVGMIAEFWLLLSYVGVPPDLTRFVFLFTVVRLAFLVPLPGGIGSVEAALLWSFQELALPLSAAAGLIMLMRLRDIAILLTGAAMLPGMQTPMSRFGGSQQ
jgi:uncharacterized protein (TIRG00374 family)